MSHKAVRIGITSVVLSLAFGGLLWSTLSEGTEYYKHVDEITADPAAWQGKKLQVHGFIVEKSILRRPDTLDWRFEIENNGEILKAEYSGLVPDTFQGRGGGRRQGPAGRQRYRGGAERGDGQVSVEVRAEGRRRGRRGVFRRPVDFAG